MRPKKNRRIRVLADPRLQGAICLRISLYWVVCQIGFAATVCAIFVLHGGNDSGLTAAQVLVPGLIVSFLILPIALVDSLIFSNRFAGPLLRIGRSLKSLAEGEETGEIRLRSKDRLLEMADNVNVISRLQIESGTCARESDRESTILSENQTANHSTLRECELARM